ncbi:MAG: hypothetical protein AB1295_00320 [Candidatus Micrarchaeota archaeon]
MSEYFIVEPCTTASGIEIKLKDHRIDLKKAERALSKAGEIAGTSAVVLLVSFKGYSISVYGSGRMMVKGKDADKKVGEALAKELISLLTEGGAIV